MCNCTGAPVCQKEHLVDCPNRKKIPHKHAELIKAWADGVEIEQQRVCSNNWYSQSNPCWNEATAYRIKPEPKPDVVLFAYLVGDLFVSHYANQKNKSLCGGFSAEKLATDNTKLIYDGETGKLKSVCLINA